MTPCCLLQDKALQRPVTLPIRMFQNQQCSYVVGTHHLRCPQEVCLVLAGKCWVGVQSRYLGPFRTTVDYPLQGHVV